MESIIVAEAEGGALIYLDSELKERFRKKLLCASAPRRIAAKGRFLYVACDSGDIVKCDGSGRVLRAETVGSCLTAALAAEGGIYVACGETNRVLLLNPRDLSLRAELHCRDFPLSLAASADGRFIVTACMRSGMVLVADALLRVVRSVAAIDFIYCATIDSAGALYCACGNGTGTLRKYAANGAPVYSKKLGAMPTTVKLSLDEKTLAVARTGEGGVLLLRSADGEQTGAIDDISTPDDLLFTSDGLLISDMTTGRVALAEVRGKNARIIKTAYTGGSPRGIAVL